MQDINELSCFYISLLRTIAIVHQSHHWLTKGSNFYGNHLLFDRIYKTAAEDSDLAAEKFIGLFGSDALNLEMQSKIMGKLLEEYTGNDIIKVSIDIETRFLKFSESIYKEIKNDDKMSLGLDDMLMSIASNREGALYLLGQVVKPDNVKTNDQDKVASRVNRLKSIVLNSNVELSRIEKLKSLAGEFKKPHHSVFQKDLYDPVAPANHSELLPGNQIDPGDLAPPKDQEIDNLVEDLKSAIKNKDYFLAGKINAKIDLKEDGRRVNGAESIRLMKFFYEPEIKNTRIPLNKWEEYTLGYGEGANLSDEKKAKDLQFTKDVLENIYKRNKI
jgi:DNA-binding ferritin-like protein